MKCFSDEYCSECSYGGCSCLGPLVALKHHKDEVQTVGSGMECGLSVDAEVEFSAGDVFVCFEEHEEPQLTAWNPGF